MKNKPTVLAVIPARGGSKRIPRKNIKPFLGKPVIYYSIKAAIESAVFSNVVVSTDSREIAKISKRFGAEIPFLRSEKNASDIAPVADVLVEVLEYYARQKKQFQYICCLFSTAPFVTGQLLKEGYALLRKDKFSSVFTVVPFGHPIQRAFQMNKNRIRMIHPENYLKRTQDLPASYHDAGMFYWLDVKKFLKEKKLFFANSGAIVLDELHSHDIDSPGDWKLAEMKVKLLKNKNHA